MDLLKMKWKSSPSSPYLLHKNWTELEFTWNRNLAETFTGTELGRCYMNLFTPTDSFRLTQNNERKSSLLVWKVFI